MSHTRVAVVGASGRMGTAVVRLAMEQPGLDVVATVGLHELGRDAGELAVGKTLGVRIVADLDAVLAAQAGVIIDFSTPAATRGLCAIAVRAGAALVSGTTGLDEPTQRALGEASERVPVLWEPNMSVGVHVLGELVRRAIALLGLGWDVEIVETHHRLKIDAPSGTALRLADIARQARGDDAAYAHGREGKPGARPQAQIGLHALRGGDVIGDHTVHLLGNGERIELTHRASSRELFAHGAVRAAMAIAGRPAGRYRMADAVLASPM